MDGEYFSSSYKLELILKRLIENTENRPLDSNYLEQISSHFLLQSQVEEKFLHEETLSRWLELNIDQLEGLKWAHTFVLQILRVLCAKEENFSYQLKVGTIERIQLWYVNGLFAVASTHLAYILFLRTVTKHNIGLTWLKQNELWKVSLTEKKRTIYIIRESGAFLYDLLYHLNAINDEQTCMKIIKQLLAPFVIGVQFENGTTVSIVDQQRQRSLLSSLENLEQIFINFVDAEQPTRLVYHFFVTFQMHKLIVSSIMTSYDTDYLTKLRRCHVYSNILQLAFLTIPPEDKLTKPYGIRQFSVKFYNMIAHCIQRRHCRDILICTELYSYLWHKLRAYLPIEEVPESWNLCFGDQVLVIHILPVLHAIKEVSEPSIDLNEFCVKILSTSCEQTVRHVYGFRDVIIQTNMKGELAMRSARGLIAMSNYMSRDRAIFTFQALVYILNQYVPHIEDTTKANTGKDLVIYCANLLSVILSGLAIFIAKYKFSWKDCLEATSITHLAISLLNNPSINCRLSIKTLTLVRLSIEHFLSPNMFLLVDQLEGTSLEILGPTITKKLHDEDSDVRDSALELIYSITEISRSKFPTFKKLLLTNNICENVWKLSETDTDNNVRVMAFKCVAKMVTIKNYWDCIFNDLNVLEKLLNILHAECDGQIRKEAAGIVVAIFPCSDQKNQRDELFKTFAFLTNYDENWEVRLKAIHFWHIFLDQLFTNEGAYCGRFPKETFSREHKKIVQLTSSEIHKRLKKIVSEFSEKGGFGVLLALLHEENNIQVLNKAIELIDQLIQRLREYNYDFVRQVDWLDGMITDDPSPTIDSLTTTDRKLWCNGEHVNKYDIHRDNFHRYTNLDADDFIKIISTVNLKKLMMEKDEKLRNSNNFDSILEDVLLTLQYGRSQPECF